jgi:hypothetical protein
VPLGPDVAIYYRVDGQVIPDPDIIVIDKTDSGVRLSMRNDDLISRTRVPSFLNRRVFSPERLSHHGHLLASFIVILELRGYPAKPGKKFWFVFTSETHI